MISFSEIINHFNNYLTYNITIDNNAINAVKSLEKNTIFNSNILYVGYVSTINHFETIKDTNLILIKDEELKNPIQANYLLLANIDNIYEIINIVQDMINASSSYSNEKINLFSLFLTDNSTDALCQKCAQYINNPIIITDTSYNIVSYSRHHDISDEVWKSGTKRGNLTYEFVSLLTGINSNYFETDGTRIKYLAKDISKHQRKIYKCLMNNNFLGYLIILEYYHPFNKEYDIKEELILKLLSKQISLLNTAFVSSYKQQELNLVSDLLHNKVTSRIIFNTRLESTYFKEFNYYQIISINVSNYAFSNSMQGELKTKLDRLDNVILLLFEKNIVILNLLKKPFNKNLKTIIDILDKYNLEAGASNIFKDLFNLYNHYLQSLNALRFNTLVLKKGPIYNYNDISFYHLLANIRYDQLESYCNQNILNIYHDDLDNHTNNLDTLYNYLRYGKNISKTAKYMFLHRNTINYRIEQIIDIYDLDMEDPDSLFTYLFSATIIRYLSCAKLKDA